jgi:hypothetical protein
MFTLEIGGKPVAITDADEERARDVFLSPDFKGDLVGILSGGQPIWDGAAGLDVRRASDEEIDAFDQVMADDDEDSEEGEVNVLFLIPVDDLEEAEAPPPSRLS